MIDKIKKHLRPLIDRPRYNPFKGNNVKPVNNIKKGDMIQELVSGSANKVTTKPPMVKQKAKPKNKHTTPPAKNKFKKPNPPKLPTKKDEGGVFKQLKDKLKGK